MLFSLSFSSLSFSSFSWHNKTLGEGDFDKDCCKITRENLKSIHSVLFQRNWVLFLVGGGGGGRGGRRAIIKVSRQRI